MMCGQYDTRSPPATSPTSAISNLLALSARLLFLQISRQRKRRLVAHMTDVSLPRSILAPLLQSLQHTNLVRGVQRTLKMIGDTLSRAGVRNAITSRLTGANKSDIGLMEAMMSGAMTMESLGAVLSLVTEGW